MARSSPSPTGGVPMPVNAYVLIQTEVGRAATVARTVAALDGVVAAEGVTGPYDVIVRDRGRDRGRTGPDGGGPHPADRGDHPHRHLPGGQPLGAGPDPAAQRMAPEARRPATSAASRPQSARASSACCPGLGGGRRMAPGCARRTGARVPAGRTPATSVKVPRARLWGWSGASARESTGATQASVPSKTSSHSARVRWRRWRRTAPSSPATPRRSIWSGRSSSSSPSRRISSA